MKEITIFDNDRPDVSIRGLDTQTIVEDYVSSLKHCGFQEISGKILIYPCEKGKLIKIILE